MRRIASHAAAIVIGIAICTDSPALFVFAALVMFSFAPEWPMFSPTRSAARPVHLTSRLCAGRERVGTRFSVEFRGCHGAHFLRRNTSQPISIVLSSHE